jgi:hypothetical protein
MPGRQRVAEPAVAEGAREAVGVGVKLPNWSFGRIAETPRVRSRPIVAA